MVFTRIPAAVCADGTDTDAVLLAVAAESGVLTGHRRAIEADDGGVAAEAARLPHGMRGQVAPGIGPRQADGFGKPLRPGQ